MEEAKPCKYCDENEEYVILKEITGNLGIAGTIESAMALSNCHVESAKLCISIWHENTERIGGSVDEDKIIIKYCPFCGRRIGSGE